MTIRFDDAQPNREGNNYGRRSGSAGGKKILAVPVEPGSKVEEDDELVVIEALKMENTVYAPSDGAVKQIKVKIGDSVEDEALLLVLE